MKPPESDVIPIVCLFAFLSDVTRSWSAFICTVVVSIVGIPWTEATANEQDQTITNQAAGSTIGQGAPPLRPRMAPVKPSDTVIKPWHDRNRVIVKFAEGSDVRLSQQGLVSLKGRDLGRVRAALARHRIGGYELRRYFTRPEEALDQDRHSGEARSGRQLADLNLYFEISVADEIGVGTLCDDLNALELVELAEPAPIPVPPPVDISPLTPDFSGRQGYLDAPPDGIGITDQRSVNGIDGTGTAFVDIEYDWVLEHEDLGLPATTIIDHATLDNPFPELEANHGTAVLGQIVAADNDFGVVGLAPAASAFVAPANTLEFGYNVGRAVNLAARTLNAGDAILIEQQIAVCGSEKLGPVEWVQAWYDAIAAATANGIIVVEPAGNGDLDLDDPACRSLFDAAVRDSGAIIVGAGDPGTHAKLDFSSYGSRVNVQGWGRAVTTTGYGDLFNPHDLRQRYTRRFSGTSSASSIVTGAILAIQGARNAAGLPLLHPDQIRQLLIDTGTAQSGTEHVGPLPDVGAALAFMEAGVGGSVTGMIPRAIHCENKTTGQRVRVPPADDSHWDCEEAGLNVDPGDRIHQRVSGRADGTGNVGGAVSGVDTSAVPCENRSRGKRVSIQLDGDAAWDCEAAGLRVRAGDTIVQTFQGTAE